MTGFSPSRRDVSVLFGATALSGVAGCDQISGMMPGGGSASSAADMALGPANAKVTIVEYASVTCPHCGEFHRKEWPQLKKNYIDTGKIRFIFREMPTNPVEVAVAGFQVARCNGADAETYFSRIGMMFEQQEQIYQALAGGKARDQLLTIARASGLSDDQFTQCVADPSAIKRIEGTVDVAIKQYKVTSTPAFLINNQKYNGAYTYVEMAKAIDARLAG